MTALARPDVGRHASWSVAMAELRVEGEHVNGAGWWLLPTAEQWDLSENGCARLVEVLLAAVAPSPTSAPDSSTAPGSGHVPCYFLWIVDEASPDEPVIGFLALRTELNAWLLAEGGHIGYSVAPSRRRGGHARRALQLALQRAGELGLDRVLVTCDETNVASARTIESGGGVYQDSRNGKRRYWIATA